MILLRIFLIGLIIYLLFRSFFRYFNTGEERRETQEEKRSADMKRISKDVGEYVDYEETDKK
mgnify:FL=1